MSRANEHTTLLPLSGVLLALLMIASLLGLQGAIDRALTLSSPRRLTAPMNQVLTGPPLIARQPVGRAAEAAASAEVSPASGEQRTAAGAVASIPFPNTTAVPAEAGMSPAPFAEPSMNKFTTETGEEFLTMSLFKPKNPNSQNRLTKKSTRGKPLGAHLVQSTSEALAGGKAVKHARNNGNARSSGRDGN